MSVGPRRGDSDIASQGSSPWGRLGGGSCIGVLVDDWRYDAAYGTKRWAYERMRAVAEIFQSYLGKEKTDVSFAEVNLVFYSLIRIFTLLRRLKLGCGSGKFK